jgi:hypothetical protein
MLSNHFSETLQRPNAEQRFHAQQTPTASAMVTQLETAQGLQSK